MASKGNYRGKLEDSPYGNPGDRILISRGPLVTLLELLDTIPGQLVSDSFLLAVADLWNDVLEQPEGV